MELFSQECNEKISRIAVYLLAKNERVATAESCTGGLISAAFTEFSGSSAWFVGSIIAYNNSVKKDILSVDSHTLQKYGAVSKECVFEMLMGVYSSLKSDWAIAVSGIAGPSGATADKPLGTVFIGVSYKKKVLEVSHNEFLGNRVSVRKQAVEKAVDMLLTYIAKN